MQIVTLKAGAARAKAWSKLIDQAGYTRHSMLVAILNAAAGVEALSAEEQAELARVRAQPRAFENPRGEDGPISLKAEAEHVAAWTAAAAEANQQRNTWALLVIDHVLGFSVIPDQVARVLGR